MSRDAFHDPKNPYAAPESSLAPDLAMAGVTGGTLEATLAGQTTWTIGEVLSDAWRLVTGFKGTFWLAVLMIFGAQLVMNLAMAGVVAVTRSELVAMIVGFALSVTVIWPLQFGMVMLAVKRAAGVVP